MTNGTVQANSVAFSDSSSPVSLPSGSTSFQIGAAGTTSLVLPPNINFNLPAGSTNLFGVLGLLSGRGSQQLQLLQYNLTGVPVTSGTPTATVSFTDAIPDAPQLDFYLGGPQSGQSNTSDRSAQVTQTVNFVPFRQTTNSITVPTGNYFVQANLANTTTRLISTAGSSNFPQSFTAGSAYSVVLAGKQASPQVIIYQDQTTTLPGISALRVLNLSPDAPGLDINILGGPTLATGLQYLGDSGYVDLLPRMDTFQVFVTGTNTLLSSDTIYLIAGHDYSLNLEGVLGGTGSQKFQDIVVHQTKFDVPEPPSGLIFLTTTTLIAAIRRRSRALRAPGRFTGRE